MEGALTLLVFFTFLFAILEFGRAYNIYQVLTDAAREGARYSVAPYTQTSTLPSIADVQARVNTFLNSANVTGATVDVSQTVSQTINGNPIVFTQVQVQAPYQFLFFRFATLNLKTKVVMRNETN